MPVGIEHDGYATFSSTSALDFTDIADLKVYTASVDASGAITFNAGMFRNETSRA